MSSPIVINGRFLTQQLTGVQRFAYEITRRLVELRDDVVVVAPQTEFPIDPPYDVRRIGKHDGHHWEQVDLVRHLRRAGSPLLLGLGSTGPALYRNQIVTHHDITYVRHPESFSRSFRAAYRVLMPLTLRSARRIITVSEFSRREIVDWYGVDQAKISVVNNAVGDQFTPGDPAERGDFLLAVSSPNRHKNFERLVEAAALAGVPLKIVGAQDRAFATTNAADGPARTEWLGRVSDQELVQLLQTARAFAFPSLYEGFGIPPLEAQACGCPVVAADIPPVREVLGSSVELFDPTDIDDLTRAMTAVMRDPRRASELAQLGADNVVRFSWKSSAVAVSETVDVVLAAAKEAGRQAVTRDQRK